VREYPEGRECKSGAGFPREIGLQSWASKLQGGLHSPEGKAPWFGFHQKQKIYPVSNKRHKRALGNPDTTNQKYVGRKLGGR